jgi:predicted nucleic acid-binding protein
MPLVVDASVALAWALPDESSVYADAVLTVVEREGLRVTSADETAFLAALSKLRIEVEEASAPLTVIRDGAAAATRYGLTAYDAVYVDLAWRDGLTLATLDTAMRRAAEQSQIALFRQE